MSESQAKPSRRGFLWGTAIAGAATAAAVVAPQVTTPTESTPTAEPKPAPERGGGYHLSEHVQHYYRTTQI